MAGAQASAADGGGLGGSKCESGAINIARRERRNVLSSEHANAVERGISTTVLTLVALHTSGCSAIFIERPSTASSDRPPACTRSRAAPIADFGIAAGAGLLGYGLVSACHAPCESAAPIYGLISVVAAIGVGLSGLHGLDATSECDAAWERWCASQGGCGSVKWSSGEADHRDDRLGSRLNTGADAVSGRAPTTPGIRTDFDTEHVEQQPPR